MPPLMPFHLAIQVRDIQEACNFYGSKLGFAQGRSAEGWVDFNMFGHQLVAHLNPALGKDARVGHLVSSVDGHDVPVPHFGVVLAMKDWQALSECVRGVVGEFIIEPTIRSEGQAGEQGTLFFQDPSGNALEFKGFREVEKSLFARQEGD